MIVLINQSEGPAKKIKRLVEFMDAPTVVTASPQDWHERVDGARIEAVFIGPDLDEPDIHTVMDDLGKLDPNIPIVVLSGQETA